MLYSDEVWTGIEYQVAAHMIYEGLIEDGLALVKAARERYDGLPRPPIQRNPWNEIECGGHYARAMSSWSLLLALSGWEYDGPGQSLRFTPRHTPERVSHATGKSESDLWRQIDRDIPSVRHWRGWHLLPKAAGGKGRPNSGGADLIRRESMIFIRAVPWFCFVFCVANSPAERSTRSYFRLVATIPGHLAERARLRRRLSRAKS